jgi:hypothetical protein
MTHPITPPPELVQQWMAEPEYGNLGQVTLHTLSEPRLTQIATRAAQWGADQELEACCAFAESQPWGLVNGPHVADVIRAARRPEPPSAKEQALFALAVLTSADETCSIAEIQQHWHTIRRALESLPE